MKPYERRKDPGIITRSALVVALVIVSMFYGLLAAVLPPQLYAYPAIPILFIIAIILWMLPDTGGVYLLRLQPIMIAYISLTIVWPGYVAFNLPGLPWISLTRIVLLVVLLIFLWNFSTSKEMRDQLSDATSAVLPAITVFWLYWAVMTISLIFSDQISFSLTRFVSNHIYWTMPLFLTALLATRAGFVTKIAHTVVAATVVVIVYSLYEYYLKRVVWLDYLPGFLQIDPTILATLLDSQARAGTDVYRVRGPFVASLYFAEFLIVAYPFFVYLTVNERHPVRFIALLLASVGCIVVMYLTDARSAMIGFLITSVFYVALEAWRKRSLNSRSLGAMIVLMVYPIMFVALSLIVWFWNRAHIAVLGGGQHEPSSEARVVQWAMMWPKVLTHPLGHGVGRGNTALGFFNRAGEGTVDSYFITVLLDSGYLGLPLFWMTFSIPVILGLRYFLKTSTYEYGLLAPLSLAVLNFLIVKAVSSAEAVMPLVFVFLGCIFGLIWQLERKAPRSGMPNLDLRAKGGSVAPLHSSFDQPTLQLNQYITQARLIRK